MSADIIPESELRIRRHLRDWYRLRRLIREETRRGDERVVLLEDTIRKLSAGERLDAVPCDTEGEV